MNKKSNKLGITIISSAQNAVERGVLCESVLGVSLARRKKERVCVFERVTMRERKRMRASLVSPLACALCNTVLATSVCVAV
jgi:hypothetical protein